MDEVVGGVEIFGFIGNRCPFPGRKAEGEKGGEGERAKDRRMPEAAGEDGHAIGQDPSPRRYKPSYASSSSFSAAELMQ